MKKMKSTLINLTIFLAASLFSLFIAEIILRWTDILAPYQMLPTQPISSAFVFKESPQNDRDFDWYNTLLTSPKLPPHLNVQNQKLSLNSNEKKIFLIGDSGTFGSGIKKEFIFSTLLQKSLKAKSKGTSIYNFGIPGATPPDILYLFKHYLIHYRPTIVLFTVFLANDINQSLTLESYKEKRKSRERTTKKESEYFKQLIKLYKIFKIVVLHQWDRLNPVSSFKDQNGLKVIEFADGEFSLYQKKYSDVTQHAVHSFYRVLSEMNKLCQDRGVRFALSFVPTRSQLENRLNILPDLPNAITYYQKRDIYHKDQLDFNRPYLILKQYAKKNQISFIDILPIHNKNLKESFLLATDDHPGPIGHAILANQIEKYLCSILECNEQN